MKFKTTLLLIAALASTVTMSSCKKNWNCSCDTNGANTSHLIEDETLLNARNKCKSYEGSAFGVTTTCKLD